MGNDNTVGRGFTSPIIITPSDIREYCDEHTEFIKEIYFSELGFCGCGEPSDTLELIGNILCLYKERKNESIKLPYNEFEAKLYDVIGIENPPNNYGVLQFILYTLNKVDLLEHNSSIFSSRITEKGLKLLEILEENCYEL